VYLRKLPGKIKLSKYNLPGRRPSRPKKTHENLHSMPQQLSSIFPPNYMPRRVEERRAAWRELTSSALRGGGNCGQCRGWGGDVGTIKN
jgi:hypothetical protein